MRTKRILCFLLTVMLSVLLVPGVSVQAAQPVTLWLEHASGADEAQAASDGTAIDRLYAHKSSAGYHFLLPASADLSRLTIGFSGVDQLSTADGQVVKRGDQASLFAPGVPVQLHHNKDRITVTLLKSEHIPSLFLTTESGSLDFVHKVKGNAEKGQALLVLPDGSIAYQGALSQLRGRGNATFAFDKKGYRIKLDEKTDLFGMGAHKTWELLANYQDNSLIRNALTYHIAAAAGLRFSPKARQVDLYINHEYRGTYDLTQRVEVDKTRINITDLAKATEKLNDAELDSYPPYGSRSYAKGTQKGFAVPHDPEDITGGYLIELEFKRRYYVETTGFVSKQGQPVIIKSPGEASEAQAKYIAGVFQQAENAIFAKDGVDPVSKLHYTSLIDMDSYVRKYIVEELTKNYDGNNSSQFFYKDADHIDPRLYAGPVWDYDSAYAAYGTGETAASLRPHGMYIGTQISPPYVFYPQLYKHADFKQAVRECWQQVFLPVVRSALELPGGDDSMPSIRELTDPLRASAAMNFVRWPTLNSKVRVAKTGTTYQANLDYVHNFLQKRAEYLCTQWGGQLLVVGAE